MRKDLSATLAELGSRSSVPQPLFAVTSPLRCLMQVAPLSIWIRKWIPNKLRQSSGYKMTAWAAGKQSIVPCLNLLASGYPFWLRASVVLHLPGEVFPPSAKADNRGFVPGSMQLSFRVPNSSKATCRSSFPVWQSAVSELVDCPGKSDRDCTVKNTWAVIHSYMHPFASEWLLP